VPRYPFSIRGLGGAVKDCEGDGAFEEKGTAGDPGSARAVGPLDNIGEESGGVRDGGNGDGGGEERRAGDAGGGDEGSDGTAVERSGARETRAE